MNNSVSRGDKILLGFIWFCILLAVLGIIGMYAENRKAAANPIITATGLVSAGHLTASGSANVKGISK